MGDRPTAYIFPSAHPDRISTSSIASEEVERRLAGSSDATNEAELPVRRESASPRVVP